MKKPPVTRFDPAYYQRFYEDPVTRIYDQRKHATLVQGVVNLIEWMAAPVQTVLDVGAGVGWWGEWFRKHRPDVRYVSTEYEAEVCAKYGHLQADISKWKVDEAFNLVICQGVLPYLPASGVKRAVKNLAAMCGGFLFLEAVTAKDLEGTVDASRTHTEVHRHTGAFYRELLRPYFREVGAGLFAVRNSGLMLYELEVQPDLPRKRPRKSS